MIRALYYAYNRSFRPRQIWNIGIVNEPISAFLETGARPVVRWLRPAEQGKFLADPFAIIKNQIVYIFCEEFNFRVGKGRIVCIELSNGVIRSGPKVVIELPVHMSYPYLVEDRGAVYCIPETHQAREISLYRADDFPSGWVKIATLVDGIAALDTTVFEFQGRWWLTCADEDKGPLDRLFVWHAPELLGPWRPHAANPVKTDSRSSRPAGTPFIHGGHLYRPAQDCSRIDGECVVLNHVTKLTPAEFKEEPRAVVRPYVDSDYPQCLHTLSAAMDLTLLDGGRYTSRWCRSA